jgi:hypothetical protein
MNTKTYNRKTCATAVLSISLLSAAAILSLEYSEAANAQGQKSNQMVAQSNKTKSASNSAPPIGNVQQLSKALGNNTKIIANNTNIGNPNAGKAASAQQKVTAPTAKNGLPSNPTKGSQKNAASSGSSAQQNKTAGTVNMTNATAGKTQPASKTNSTKK